MTFSIIIPCYNQSHFLDDSLESLMSQSYSNWEAIIINDGSTDNTDEIANAWVSRDSRIKLFSHSTNFGLANARNTGINIANGEFIAFLDCDDKFSPLHLDLFYNEFKNGFDIVFSSYSYFSKNDTILHTVKIDKNIGFDKILSGNIVPPVAVIFRRSTLRLTGLLDVSLASTGTEDWDLWIRFYKIGAKLGVVEHLTAFYRISLDSMSRQFITMYDALKTVSLRAYNNDSRLLTDYRYNQDDKNLTNESIKRSLLMCLGVAIVQEKYELAFDLFIKETELFGFSYKETDFRFMCSYLNFRYNTSSKDLEWVFGVLRPRFKKFIDELNVEGINKTDALNEIFSIHNKIRIKQKWGFLSPLINRISWT
jgi:glycosyltransferase involved in cell wall biosynthesis